MYPYDYDVTQLYSPFYSFQKEWNPYREPQQALSLESRIGTLERQNELQKAELTRQNEELKRQNNEIHRLNAEIHRINHELVTMSHTNVTQSRRLNRLNQRLRVVENRLTIPFKPSEGGF